MEVAREPAAFEDLAALQATGRAEAWAIRRRLWRLRIEMLQASIRIAAAKFGCPIWVFALISGSVASVLLAMIPMTLWNASPTTLLWCVAIGYIIGGGGMIPLLLDQAGETADNRLPFRLDHLNRVRIELKESTIELIGVLNKLKLLDERLKLTQTSYQQPIVGNNQETTPGVSESAEYEARRNELLSIDPGRLYPEQLEQFVEQIFSFLGYGTTHTGKTGDQGVDVIAERPGMRIAIQVKRYNNAAGNDAVQQVFAGMHHWGCHRCVVVTSSSFTSAAQALAESVGYILIGRDEVPALIRGEIIG